MFQMKPIARQVLFACGGLASAVMLAAPVAAQTPAPAPAPAAQPQTLERVTITGSNIRRTDTETTAPVQIITREDLERTGKPTVAEALRSIPGNTGGSFDESFSNSFAPGASGISLRGLGQKTTLVLINSRRTANYGAAQNLQDTFVDLNSIPTSAVERVEILKDGASAIYGSDAIAGVVNIILRRDFKGVDVSASYGSFEGKNDYRASLGLGFGDLGSQKFNVFGVLDYYKRDLLQFSDTEFQKDRDFRDRDGGRNNQSLEGGGTWRDAILTANGWVPGTQRQAIAGCPGEVLTSAQAVERGLLLATSTLNIAGNTFCTRDFNYAFTALPGAERVGLLSRGTFDVSTAVQLFAELGFSRNTTEQTFQEPFFAGTTGLRQTSAGLSPFTYNIVFGPGVAGNPLAGNAFYSGVLNDLGTRDTEISSDTLRALFGTKLDIGGWNIDAAAGYSKNDLEFKLINRITLNGTSAVFGVPTSPQPPTPVSAGATYNLNNPGLNSAAVRDQIRAPAFDRVLESELTSFDVKANTELGQLPGGAVGAAIGLDFRHETLKDTPSAIAAQGLILGQGTTATDGSRRNLALFGELALPLTRTVEASFALRHDSYSDFGSATTPKAGLKFKPSPELILRANWGRGFRAPTLVENSDSVATFFTSVIDPIGAPAVGIAPGSIVQVSGVFAGNKDLKPEKSRSATIGLVWEPSTSFNASFDVYEINWSNQVIGNCCQAIVNSGDPARVIRDPATGQIVTVLGGYENQASTFTRGFDVDARYIARSAWGRFTSRLNASYVDTFEEDGFEAAGKNGGTNTIPRLRASISQGWEQGPYLAQATVNYIHSYRQQLLAGSFFTPQDRRFQNGTYPRSVPAYATLDLFLRYSITSRFQVSGSILNVTDTMPPYDPGFSGTALYDFSLYDVRGRQYRLGARYSF
jgi:iron complex outermembrane receptor protein